MAIPVDSSVLATDAVYAIIVFLITYIVKLFFKPFAKEAKLIARFSATLVIFLMGLMKRWAHKDHHNHIDNLKVEMSSLREELKSDKIVVG